jgi:AAA domain
MAAEVTDVAGPLEELQRSLTTLIHGSSKAGKSTLAVTAPPLRLLADVESASRFLPIKPKLWKDPAKTRPPEPDGTWDTCVVPTRDWATIEKLYQWLASGAHPFNSFIIDSISELQNRYIESIAGRRQLTQNQWGDAYRTVGGLLRDIRDLTMHPTKPLECVAITAMTRQVDDKWRPWCQGQLQAVLPYLMDSVVYIYLDEDVDDLAGTRTEVRRVLTRQTDEIEAGERVGGAWPRIITNPNIAEMIDMIFGTKKEEDAS